MQKFNQRPLRRIALGATAVILVAVAAAAVYVFGGGGGSAASKPPTVPTLVSTANATIFTIDSSASEASFTIHEKLFGNPNTVVGKTSAVAGQIQVNTKDPAQSKVGEIKVDVSTLVTDNPLRNSTIQGRILQTGDPANQYATFVATSLSGLPSSVSVGQTVSFKITGALTIHQVTKTETFDAQVTLQSATVLVGTAQTTVKYEDFNLSIPNVPSVTSVGVDVVLAITFTAKA